MFDVKRLAAALFAASFLAGAGIAGAQEPPIRFAPLDDAATDRSWRTYKDRLLEAIGAKDQKALMGAIDRNVDNGPDEKRGHEEFRRRWDLDKETKEPSPVWEELRKSISLGGAFIRGEKRAQPRFCTPYVSARWPTDHDPFANGAIVSREVLMKAKPSQASETLARLSHEVVRVEDWEVADETSGVPQKWTRIRARARVGFVTEEQIRSPIEHMACFARADGQWRMISFTAGYLPE